MTEKIPMSEVLSVITSIRKELIEWEQVTPSIDALRKVQLRLASIYDSIQPFSDEHSSSLREEVTDLRNQTHKLESMIHELSKRDTSVTVQKSIRILERDICFEATNKSKRLFRNGNFSFSEIRKNADADVVHRLESILTRLGVDDSVLNTMHYLKNCGDYSAHHGRSQHDFDEWKNLLMSALGEDVEDVEASETEESGGVMPQVDTLLKLMLHYHPDLIFADPVVKPCKKPVLKYSI
mmetsp:Transcript_13660/g.20461  ORF Transcript_13660/g.20461 Transcript_13660/m.20461 type:complete len:238 (+) Transcript_13660:59-772(+)